MANTEWRRAPKRHDRDVDRNSDVMNDVAVLGRGMLEHGPSTNIFIIITV